MHIIIRTAIGAEHGMGHASRSRALARTLAERGASVSFLTETPALCAYVAPFPCALANDGMQFNAGDILILDTLDENTMPYEHCAALRQCGVHIVRIDHLHATQQTCDLLVLPNYHTPPDVVTALREAYGARLLVGPEYVLLDQEVTAQAPIPYTERMNGPIVFCAGGSDPDGVLGTMCTWTLSAGVWEAKKIALYGAYDRSPYGRLIAASQSPSGYGIVSPYSIQIFLRSFASHWLREAALVVTTMGQTVYECLYWRTPTLVIGHTDRHCQAAADLDEAVGPAVLYGGDIRTMNAETFCEGISTVYEEYRRDIYAESYGLLDSHGVERVVAAILGLH